MKGSDDETRARCYIVDHGEMIPEEECQRMLHDFLKSKRYNNIASQLVVEMDVKKERIKRLPFGHEAMPYG